MFTFNKVSDLTMKNNVWHTTTSTESTYVYCVDVLDTIGNNQLADIWRDVGNDAYMISALIF